MSNGLIRVRVGEVIDGKNVISVRRIQDVNIGKEIFMITPVDNNGDYVTGRYSGVTFLNFGVNQVIARVRYGDVVYDITLGRGMPYCGIKSNIRKIMIQRNADSGVVDGPANLVESMVVPAYRGDYDVVNPDGFTTVRHDYTNFKHITTHTLGGY